VHVIASQGDRSPLFNSCLYSCFHDHRCSGKETLLPRPTFSCEQQCKYDCMWLQEREFRSHTPPLHVQYYGKWPFIKLGPVQEPLSTLFSILNGYFHVLALLIKLIQHNPKLEQPIPLQRLLPFQLEVQISQLAHSRAYVLCVLVAEAKVVSCV
jgi:hypothetical protein